MTIVNHMAAILAAGSLAAFAASPALAGDKAADSAAAGTTIQTGAAGAPDMDQTRQIQQSLSAAGHDVQVDGVWGDQTQNALREFQQSRGLDATGMPNDETMAALEGTGNETATEPMGAIDADQPAGAATGDASPPDALNRPNGNTGDVGGSAAPAPAPQ